MSSQYLRPIDINSLVAPVRAEPRMFQHKIAGIANLVTSLNAAVEDLESSERPVINDEFDFYQEVEKFETGLIKSALRLSNGSQVKAAKLLKLNPTTLNAKIKTLKLTNK